MQREELVVDLGRDEVVVRDAELQAHHQRLDPAEDEEHPRRDHVEDPDPLVVGRRQPAEQAARRALDAVGDDLRCGGQGRGRHRGGQGIVDGVGAGLVLLRARGPSSGRRWRPRSACAGCAIQATNWAGGTAVTSAFMRAWPKPQRNAQAPK